MYNELIFVSMIHSEWDDQGKLKVAMFHPKKILIYKDLSSMVDVLGETCKHR